MTHLLFPDLFFAKPLHGIQLILGNGRDEHKQEREGDTVATLNVWQETEEPCYTTKPIWKKEERGERYQSLLKLYKTSRGFSLKIDCEGEGAFEFTPNGIGIYWKPSGTGPAHYFQTLGLSLWLELQGTPCIHANGLAVGETAIGIIAPSRTGKTTLTAALMQSGLQMMSDDMMALHRETEGWRVYPGWPQFRMWPDTAQYYSGSDLDRLEKVHKRFEKRVVNLEKSDGFYFCRHSKPLKQLYLLDRRETEKGEIWVQDISPGEALLHLLQNSILGDIYQVLGIEQARLKRLAGLLDGIALKKISYPSGLDHLPKVCKQIQVELLKGQ